MKELSHVKNYSLVELLFLHQYIDKPSDDVAVEYVKQMSNKTLVVFDEADTK